MPDTVRYLLLAVSSAALTFVVVTYAQARLRLRNLTRVERVRLAMEEQLAERDRPSPTARVRGLLAKAGWEDGMTPPLLVFGFAYVSVAVVLMMLGVPELVGLAVGLPATAGLVAAYTVRRASRRQVEFQRQLLQALRMLVTQVESGSGPQRALEQVVGAVDDPLSSELAKALAETVATKDLVRAMKGVEERFPSRAMSLFVAALEVDRIQGGALTPALRQASELLQRQFELAEEAAAELSQARAEFWALVGVIAFIAVSQIAGADPTTRSSYLSPVGLALIGAGTANALVGVWRALAVFRRVKGGAL